MDFNDKLIREIKHKDETLNELLGNIPGVLFSCLNEKDMTMLFMSNGAYELTGFESDQLLLNKYSELIHKNDRERCWKIISKNISQKKSYKVVYRITTADFKEKWVLEQGMGSKYVEENGVEYGAYIIEGYISDITELVKSGILQIKI